MKAMDWREATRKAYHSVLNIEKCPAEIKDRKGAICEAVKIVQSRRSFFSNIGRATSALGLYAITVDTPWRNLVVDTAKNVFRTSLPQLEPAKYVFQGEASKNTETFYISTKDWKISYDVTGDPNNEQYMTFAVFVYPEDSIIFIDFFYHNGFGKDYTVIHHGPGNYYLKVVSSYCRWQIAITELSQ